MERYFILMLIAMLVGITKKNNHEPHSPNYQEEKGIIATPSQNNVDYADAHAIYEFETLPGVGTEQRIYDIIVNNNSIPKIAKNWRRREHKATCSANPRILFNILRSLPMGEPYFIQ